MFIEIYFGNVKLISSAMEFIQTKPGIYIKTEKAGQGTEDGFQAYLDGFFYKFYDLTDNFINKIYTRKDSKTSIWHQLADELKKEDPSFDSENDFLIVRTDDKNLKKILKMH